jgi:dTMP kinase
MHTSLFISFEGLEGSGKSTQVGLLSSKLKEENYSIEVTREPGGTRIGELIRDITHGKENVDLTAACEAYLMAASRGQHVREIIKPALTAHKIVICDRYIDSSLAYQGYGRGLGETTIEQLNHLAIDEVYPDITFFLDVPVDVGIARRSNSNKIDRLDLQQKDFYERVHQGYVKLSQKFKNRFLVIDATLSIEVVAQEVWKKVMEKIKSNGI